MVVYWFDVHMCEIKLEVYFKKSRGICTNRQSNSMVFVKIPFRTGPTGELWVKLSYSEMRPVFNCGTYI